MENEDWNDDDYCPVNTEGTEGMSWEEWEASPQYQQLAMWSKMEKREEIERQASWDAYVAAHYWDDTAPRK